MLKAELIIIPCGFVTTSYLFHISHSHLIHCTHKKISINGALTTRCVLLQSIKSHQHQNTAVKVYIF